MSGIEFYPQKEFDEDMEDKSDNDKIRVSLFFFFFFHTLIFPCSFPSTRPRENVRPLGLVLLFVFPHKSCDHVEMSPFNRRPCPLPWWAATKNTKWMEKEFWGGRLRGESLKVVNMAFVYQHPPYCLNLIMNSFERHYKGLGIWFGVIYVLQLRIPTIVSSPSWGISWSGKLLLNL